MFQNFPSLYSQVIQLIVGLPDKSCFIGLLPGEMSPKAISRCFWHREVEEELSCHGLREDWTFSKTTGPTSGTYDHAMQIIDKKRCEQLYMHNCSDHCRSKGRLSILHVNNYILSCSVELD